MNKRVTFSSILMNLVAGSFLAAACSPLEDRSSGLSGQLNQFWSHYKCVGSIPEFVNYGDIDVFWTEHGFYGNTPASEFGFVKLETFPSASALIDLNVHDGQGEVVKISDASGYLVLSESCLELDEDTFLIGSFNVE